MTSPAGLPDFYAPERGSGESSEDGIDPAIGMVVIEGTPYSPDDAIDFAERILAAAHFARTQGTHEVPNMPGAGMVLRCHDDGSSWLGTYGVTVTAMLKDLLNDGEPVDIYVFAGMKAYDGRLVAVTEGELVFEDARRIDIDGVMNVEIP